MLKIQDCAIEKLKFSPSPSYDMYIVLHHIFQNISNFLYERAKVLLDFSFVDFLF